MTAPDSNTCHIRFFANVDESSIKTLISHVDQQLAQGVRRFALLISSGGGTVFHGLSAYNYLKGIPAEVVTHNFGSVDSIGVVIFCAGSKRYSVPHARFLLHGVQSNFPAGASLEEKQLEERLKGHRIDTENIAGVIAANCGKSEEEVHRAMLDRATLNPEQAVEWGLVHEIKEQLMEVSGPFVSIQ